MKRHIFPALSAALFAFGTVPGTARETFWDGVFIYDSSLAEMDLYVADDAAVGGNLCVGDPCSNTETFMIKSVVKLIGLAPGIQFKEAINPGASADWWMGSDYLGFGGADRFSIEDLAADTLPFSVEAGAPDNALWIATSGNIGFGTYLPAAHLHVLDGVQPTLRLEQDGSGGHLPATWDMMTRAADGAFALRDPAGALTPFVIAPGTETNALVAANDSIGIGISTGLPRAKLHVDLDTSDATYPYGFLLGDGLESFPRPDLPGAMAHILSHQGHAMLKIEEDNSTVNPRTLLHLENNGRPEIVMTNSSADGEWSFGAGTDFFLKQGRAGTLSSSKTKILTVKATGDAILAGTLTTGGTTCGGGCDRVFDDGYDLPSIADHAAAMFALGHLPNVGPTVENQPINISDKLGRMLNELEHAHIYIARQQSEIDRLTARLAAFDALDARLRVLEGHQ